MMEKRAGSAAGPGVARGDSEIARVKPGFRFTLYLVRHGEAEGNQRGAFLGRRDVSLTNTGRSQTLELRARIRDLKIDVAYVSPLRRARETASLLLAERDLEPTVDARLAEQDYGRWDGLIFPEARTAFPDDFRAWRRGDPRTPPTGGETLQAVAVRMQDFYAELAKTVPAGSAALLVGHAGAFQTLICQLMGVGLRNFWPFRLQPASLTEIEMYASGPSMTRLSWR